MSFHVFRSLISFNDILSFPVHKSYTSFVKFISKYFIPFDAIINKVIFTNSLLDCSLAVYRNTTEIQNFNLVSCNLNQPCLLV